MSSTPSVDDMIRLTRELLIPFARVSRSVKLSADEAMYENDAEHSFMLAALACSLAPQLDTSLNLGKVSQYALVHDLVEVHAGDTSIWAGDKAHDSKVNREMEALDKIARDFNDSFPWITETIERYKHLEDDESRFVYALDKIMPILVMVAVDHQPFPPALELHLEKAEQTRTKIGKYPQLLPYFETLLVVYRAKPHFFRRQAPAT